MNDKDSIFSRSALVLGHAAMERLSLSRVAVFGLGGVGSYAAEALSRVGVGSLDIIDGDVIEESNINRQLYALHSTLGQAKTDVAAARIKDINSACRVRAIKTFYLPEGNSEAEKYIAGASYVVDAVDTVAAKTGIILAARRAGVPVISCMGTGGKIDPALLRLADISETSVCPLARAVRRQLRARGVTDGVLTVYSTEKPVRSPSPSPDEANVIGSVPFVPATAGMIMASAVVRHILAVQDA